MIRAVLFDMDGLMFDTERLIADLWDSLGEERGIGEIAQVMPETMGMRDGDIRKFFCRRFGEDFPFEWFNSEYRKRMDEGMLKSGLPVKPGLYTLLNYLKKRGDCKLAVASSTSRKHVLQYCEMAHVTDFFDAIICGDMVRKSKPDPQIYLVAAKEVGIPAQDCMVLEDSPNGCVSGSRAGAKVVMVPDLVQPDEALKKILYACVGTLEDVVPLLERDKSGENG